jgi:hypothetical protein
VDETRGLVEAFCVGSVVSSPQAVCADFTGSCPFGRSIVAYTMTLVTRDGAHEIYIGSVVCHTIPTRSGICSEQRALKPRTKSTKCIR